MKPKLKSNNIVKLIEKNGVWVLKHDSYIIQTYNCFDTANKDYESIKNGNIFKTNLVHKLKSKTQ